MLDDRSKDRGGSTESARKWMGLVLLKSLHVREGGKDKKKSSEIIREETRGSAQPLFRYTTNWGILWGKNIGVIRESERRRAEWKGGPVGGGVLPTGTEREHNMSYTRKQSPPRGLFLKGSRRQVPRKR